MGKGKVRREILPDPDSVLRSQIHAVPFLYTIGFQEFIIVLHGNVAAIGFHGMLVRGDVVSLRRFISGLLLDNGNLPEEEVVVKMLLLLCDRKEAL